MNEWMDGWCVDEKHFFHCTPIPYLTTYVLTIHNAIYLLSNHPSAIPPYILITLHFLSIYPWLPTNHPQCIYLLSNHQVPYLSFYTRHFTFSTYLTIVTYLVVTKCLTSLHTNHFHIFYLLAPPILSHMNG